MYKIRYVITNMLPRPLRKSLRKIFDFFDILFFKKSEYTLLFNAHALGGWHGHIHTNCKEAFMNSYKNGFRIFEVDISKTKDDKFVAIHCWVGKTYTNLELPFDDKNPILTENEFISQKLLSHSTEGATPLSLNDIFRLMREYPDVTVMFDLWPLCIEINAPSSPYTRHIAEKDIQHFISFFHEETIAERSIIEVYSLPNALTIRNLGFKNAQLWVFGLEQRLDNFKTIEQYISFLTKNNIHIVSISAGNARRFPEEIAKLKHANITVFSPGWNRYRHLRTAERIGIDVITTDFLLPGTIKEYPNEGV